mmetsp:Transcript_27513/g.49562  ORF Transcript_27513/g.49562 Transcript_27513/m.49562 type:complete len:667 (-) Transcript_27513:1689-3689(-)
MPKNGKIVMSCDITLSKLAFIISNARTATATCGSLVKVHSNKMESQASARSLSNLEMKVKRNTFSNHSNSIRQIDQSSSRFSLSKVSSSSSASHNSSQAFSVSQSFQKLLSSQIDPTQQDLQAEEAGLWLQQQVRTISAGSVLSLPPQRIKLSDLTINTPFTMRGSPGTVLELTDGSIVLDFSSHSKESLLDQSSERATICEVSIEFNNINASSRDSQSPLALFILDASNTHLEVRDCTIANKRQPGHESSYMEETGGPSQDICFWVNGYAVKKAISRSVQHFNSTLSVHSCSIRGFAQGLRAGCNATVHFERCHFSQCKNTGLLCSLPREFSLLQSVIEEVGNCAVEIRLVGEPSGLSTVSSRSTSPANSKEPAGRVITIEGNEIRNCGAYGLNIWSEQVNTFHMTFHALHNKILNCKKDALAVRHVALTELQISYNDLYSNQGSSIWIQKVYRASVDSKIVISFNRCFDSQLGYGIYLYNSYGLLDNNECYRNGLGGIMVVGSSGKEDPLGDLVIRKCTVHTNGENGITVMDYLQGIVFIEQCRVSENYHNGIYLSQSREPVVPPPVTKVIPYHASPGSVLVDRCMIQRNRRFGITMSKVPCELTETEFAENTLGKVSTGESRHLLKITGNERSKEIMQISEEWAQRQNKKAFCGKASKDCLLL